MTRRMTDNDIWKKDWYLDLPIKKKLLVKYLYDNCDCAGIYEISYRTLKYCFNEEITREDFEGIKQIRFISENKIFIEDFIKFQYGVDIDELKPNKSNVHKGICKSLKKNGLLTLDQPLTNPCLRVLDKDKDKYKDINTSINNKPKKEEILSYVNSLCKKIEVEDFIAYYDAADWKDKDGLPINWKQKAIQWANRYKPKEKADNEPSEAFNEFYKKEKARLAAKGIY